METANSRSSYLEKVVKDLESSDISKIYGGIDRFLKRARDYGFSYTKTIEFEGRDAEDYNNQRLENANKDMNIVVGNYQNDDRYYRIKISNVRKNENGKELLTDVTVSAIKARDEESLEKLITGGGRE